MLAKNREMKLVITEGNKVIETVSKETDPHPAQMIKSLNDFRQLVNAALTKLIEDPESLSLSDGVEDDEDSEEEEDSVEVSPKRKKV